MNQSIEDAIAKANTNANSTANSNANANSSSSPNTLKLNHKRRPFQGVLNILSFNRHFYYFGIVALGLIWLVSVVFDWTGWSFWVVIGAFGYGLLMPLIVSAYVYDFAGYYHLDWLEKLIPDPAGARTLVNINAGFDETSFLLASRFPKAGLHVFDFYDAKRHTEPAIIRARKVSLVYPNTRQISSDHIPLESGSADFIFLLSALHEIRSHTERVAFLKSCRDVLKSNGRVIMVEHLRDVPNFLAFTVGFTHFFSAQTWRKAFRDTGFESIEERKFTPFMSVFVARESNTNH
jgi:SAM-dependent methyltransferase